jgi:acetyltransferase-like isoleucine patch superfamily enzyme
VAVLLTLVTNENKKKKYIYINETIQKHNQYKYAYYQNTHKLQNPHINTPTHYKTQIYTHPHINTHPHIYTSPHIYTHPHTHIYTHTHTFTRCHEIWEPEKFLEPSGPLEACNGSALHVHTPTHYTVLHPGRASIRY